jgi:hypothetical protein
MCRLRRDASVTTVGNIGAWILRAEPLPGERAPVRSTAKSGVTRTRRGMMPGKTSLNILRGSRTSRLRRRLARQP